MLHKLSVEYKHIRLLLHSCTLSHEKRAPYRAGGLEVNGAGYLTAVRDGVPWG